MQKKKAISIIILLSMCCLQSCGLLYDDGPGTGTISVMMNNKHYNLTNVTGTEYLGFYCGGELEGAHLGLGLGQSPHSGDTIYLSSNNQNTGFYGIYGIYKHSYNIPGSGSIIISKKSGEEITGKFYFDVIVDSDTIKFRNGEFRVDFPPSR